MNGRVRKLDVELNGDVRLLMEMDVLAKRLGTNNYHTLKYKHTCFLLSHLP